VLVFIKAAIFGFKAMFLGNSIFEKSNSILKNKPRLKWFKRGSFIVF